MWLWGLLVFLFDLLYLFYGSAVYFMGLLKHFAKRLVQEVLQFRIIINTGKFFGSKDGAYQAGFGFIHLNSIKTPQGYICSHICLVSLLKRDWNWKVASLNPSICRGKVPCERGTWCAGFNMKGYEVELKH